VTSLFALGALIFAAECLIGSALVLGAAWLAARGRSASVRHLIWFTAFGVLLVLPLLAAIVPPQVLIEQAAAAPSVPAKADAVMLAAAVPPPAGFTVERAVEFLFIAWLTGVVFVALRGAVGFFGLRALYRRSVPYFPENADTSKFVVAGRNWKLRLSTMPGAVGPMTWGIFRPVVLLPKAAVLWPRERLESVLLHELAHVRRYDSVAQLLSLMACALYWPNPLAWIGARALRREAEIAADDAVLLTGVKPSAYAGQLVDLAREFRGRAAFAGLAMAAPSALEERVQSVLAPTQSRSGVTKMEALKIAGIGLAAASLLVLARPSIAQADEPPPPPAVDEPAPPPELDVDVAMEPPAAPAALPAPPAPPAPPAVGAVPPVPPAPPMTSITAEVRIVDPGKPERVIRVQGPDAAKIMAEVHPQIERAMQQARRAQDQARVVMQHRIEIEATVSDAMRKAQPEIDRALAEADRAMAEANEALKRVKIRVEVIRKERDEHGTEAPASGK
jgi:beta-lactamase regulating signal transducer with metallopeptidase domain